MIFELHLRSNFDHRSDQDLHYLKIKITQPRKCQTFSSKVHFPMNLEIFFVCVKITTKGTWKQKFLKSSKSGNPSE